MIRCKGKQNIKGFRESCRQWYSLAVNGLNTALTDNSYSRTIGYSRGASALQNGQGSHEREITEVGREITFGTILV